MSNLYTAFKGFHNTSFQLVSQLCGDKLFLTNSFQGLEKEILSLGTDYDAIYMFGTDINLKNSIRIETCVNYNGELVNTFSVCILAKARILLYKTDSMNVTVKSNKS